ncbi:amino acid adenylation domain-containing protein [Kineococcus sp. T13]|uniref:amino acid adenylation domain-containing protein n=1 Tax=Kineococcus vitellinus TaxID=2696565 RepID=UPI0014121BFE|nr:amino acid adenylation domain-containing protein [Kineococcus vitellinus]NAZ76679.1 amino acid adenylation domain-containing protein [Kineococcus vitellinus]
MPELDAGAFTPALHDAPAGSGSFLDLVEERAAAAPYAVAVVDAGGPVRYGDLLSAARRVAGTLVARGVVPGDLVGVQAGRAAATVSVLLGTMLAGAAYVPLDPSHPPARRLQALRRADCTVVLVDASASADERAALAREVQLLDTAEALAGPALTGPGRQQPDSPAYVLFTSGSTGEPKGVQVTHRNLNALLGWAVDRLHPADVELTGAGTAFTFDPSVLELYATLVLGGTLRLMSSALDLLEVGPGITFLFSTPSVLGELARARRLPRTLRVLMVGGEALEPAVAEAILAECPAATLLHVYGPTEATVWVTVQELRHGDGQRPHLGRELPGTRVWVLAEDGSSAPDGDPGELCISGPQVAAGYVGRPDLTAQRFVDWCAPTGEAVRLYRTGDRTVRDGSGHLHFLGRMDRQVKLRGHRIELDEVQRALLLHPAVTESAVVVAGEGGLAHLVAFVVLDGTGPAGRGPEDAELLAPLREQLAPYMVPSVLHRLDAMPRTTSGKVHTTALAERATVLAAGAGAGTGSGERSAGGSAAEERVAAAVADVLGLSHPPAPADDFLLDLGGTSLALLRLLSQLERATGTRVGLDGVMADTTVAGIAAQLERPRTPETAWLDGGPGTPLVLLHLYVGGILKYRSLAGRLPHRRTLLVDPQAGTATRPGAEVDLADLARRAAEVVRREVPEGPYVLGGHSAGGLLALEVAAVLHEQGEQVAEVVLVDSAAVRGRAGYYWGELVLHVPEFVAASWRDRVQKASVILAKRVPALRRGAVADGVVAAVYDREAASTAAVLRTRSRPYDGRVTLLRTTQGQVMAMGRDLLGWRGLLTGRVRVRDVPGPHNGVFEVPYVDALAAELEDAAREAERTPPGTGVPSPRAPR